MKSEGNVEEAKLGSWNGDRKGEYKSCSFMQVGCIYLIGWGLVFCGRYKLLHGPTFIYSVYSDNTKVINSIYLFVM